MWCSYRFQLHCLIFLLWCKWYGKYFSMGKRLKLLTTFTSWFKKEKWYLYVFNAVKNMNVPFKCFENYDLIIRILFVLKKKSVRHWKRKERCIPLHYTKCNFRRKCNFIKNKSNHWSAFQINIYFILLCFSSRIGTFKKICAYCVQVSWHGLPDSSGVGRAFCWGQPLLPVTMKGSPQALALL